MNRKNAFSSELHKYEVDIGHTAKLEDTGENLPGNRRGLAESPAWRSILHIRLSFCGMVGIFCTAEHPISEQASDGNPVKEACLRFGALSRALPCSRSYRRRVSVACRGTRSPKGSLTLATDHTRLEGSLIKGLSSLLSVTSTLVRRSCESGCP